MILKVNRETHRVELWEGTSVLGSVSITNEWEADVSCLLDEGDEPEDQASMFGVKLLRRVYG